MKHTVTELKLKNGAQGLVINIPDALVMSFDFNFRAGEYLVNPKKWEIPHLMEHVLLGANELIPKARDFYAELEKNGAYSNASTGIYDIDYEAECADFEWDRVLNLLLVAISKPLFLEDEFNSEFGNVKEELTARANNHFRTLSLEMRKAVNFIAETDAERLKLIDNVKVEDLKEHYLRTHTSKNLRFVIAGNLSSTRLKKLTSMLENIELPKGSKRFDLPSEKVKIKDSPVYLPKKGVKNIYFYLDTFLSRRLSETEEDALNLLNTYLTETLYSKILGDARDKGLLYDMSSGISYNKEVTNWWFGAQVSEANIKALLDIFIRVIPRVCRGAIKEDDIISTKQYQLGRFQRSAQTVSGTANGYTGKYFFDGSIDDYFKIPDRIKAITKEEIVKVANLMFQEKLWALGILGSCGDDLAEELANQISVLWI